MMKKGKKLLLSVVCAAEILAVAGGMTACGSANNSDKEQTQITLERAEEIALADAGLTTSEVTSIKTNADFEDGNAVYDVEFYADNMKYEYEVNANTGDIYSRSKETLNNQGTMPIETRQNISSESLSGETQQSTDISDENQKDVQNVTPSGGTQQNTQNTTPSSGTQQGAQSVNPSSGTQQGAQSVNPSNGAQQDNNGQITLDTAKSTALSDAGLSASDVTFTKEKLDYEDGVAVYDLEFYTSTHAYEYEINAATGGVYSRDVDAHSYGAGHFEHNTGHTGHTGNAAGAAAYIGEDKAKSIAVSHAGFSAADVSFTKAELDSDDGQAVYEIEFYKDGREYEYEINAATGAIIEYDID